jgi:hypothetical protein
MSDVEAAVPGAKKIDGHRLSEFIYGTITGMVALEGLGAGHDTNWLNSALAVIAGAFAIWLAHGYSIMIAKRVTSGHRLAGAEIRATFAGSWPIVIAGVVLSIPFFLVPFGILSEGLASDLASVVGVVVLALVGIQAGILAKETWPRRLLIALTTAGLGVVVVLIEFVVAH